MTAPIYDFSVNTLDGRLLKLEVFRNKVMLIVNTASQCGFTPQYQGLEQLYQKYRDRGLVVLGFPCNQFGQQEPGTNQEVAAFCAAKFQVTFPMFEKISVNGDDAHPLYRFLKEAEPGLLGTQAIKWNFTKFLVGCDGQVVKRYAPIVTPAALEDDIEQVLPQG
ncbi:MULTISPECIES: glutathione peroxidase [Methylomonas]|uniref:glutathione peroxidase n=1 Tax=Methylomonas TaxID=416 RepID=UPI001231AFFF